MKILLIGLLYSLLAYSDPPCHPQCNWQCEEVVCNSFCQVNGCDVICQKPELSICPEPKCELKCQLPACNYSDNKN